MSIAESEGSQPSVVVTITARVSNWRALRKLHDELLVEGAREVGALGFRLYRDLHNASQMLIMAELPDREASQELRERLGRCLDRLLGAPVDERVWEPTGWQQVQRAHADGTARKEVG